MAPASHRFSVLSTPAAVADPYPLYEWLRAQPAIYWCDPSREWLVSRYEEVRDVLLRPALFSSARRVDNIMGGLPSGVREAAPALEDDLRHWLLFMDEPGHGRLRRVVLAALTNFGLMERSADHVVSIADELLGRATALAKQVGQVDFMATFAQLFPLRVISALLGVPDHNFPIIEQWSDDIARFLVILPRAADTAERAEIGFREVSVYLHDLLAQRRAAPRDDLLSALAHARPDGEALTDTEIINTAAMLLFQGHETTKNLLVNGLLALLRHPAMLARLRADPSLIPAAADELARYDSSIQFVTRVPRCDTDLGGTRIGAGQLVVALIGSANRDPAVFAHADELHLDRDRRGEPSPLSFGIAHHLCIGRALARLEVQTALRRLLDRWSSVELVETPTHRHILSIRSVAELPVRVISAATEGAA